MSDLNSSTVRRITVVTARGQYQYSLSGRFIDGEGVVTSAVSPEAARLACGTLAGEQDGVSFKARRLAENWAASMLLYMASAVEPEPSAPMPIRVGAPVVYTAGAAEVARMMAETGATDRRTAFEIKFAEWEARRASRPDDHTARERKYLPAA